VNSMSDLFHEDVPEAFILRVFDVMGRASQHQFQLLTKRSARMADIASRRNVPRNVWMGVSVENERYLSRIDDLRELQADVRFISVEPLLGPIRELPLQGIHWVIVGGESGPRARPMSPAWVRSIREQCNDAGVAFFFKQWGGVQKKRAGRELDGRTWNEMPQTLAVMSTKQRGLSVVSA
jgi:protein gp37